MQLPVMIRVQTLPHGIYSNADLDWVSLYKYDSNPVGIYMDQYLNKNTETS
jgi:hypothetical protein